MSIVIDLFLFLVLPILGYASGRAHARLMRIDLECAADAEAYEAGVKHGLEVGIMSGCAHGLTTKQQQRHGVVLSLN